MIYVLIHDFLWARINEDERSARTPGTWLNRCAPRILAECAIKRRIVEMHSIDETDPVWVVCKDCLQLVPCLTLCLLATIYANHPDYSEDWKV